MSKEAVLVLFETLDKDPDLTERLSAIAEPAEVVRIAESELGLNFTAEELIYTVASIQNEEELNEEELEAVAGGCGRPPRGCGSQQVINFWGPVFGPVIISGGHGSGGYGGYGGYGRGC